MRLQLLGRRGIVDIADEYAPVVNVLLVLAEVLARLVQRRLHLPELGRLGLHLGHAPLHGRNLFLVDQLASSCSSCCATQLRPCDGAPSAGIMCGVAPHRCRHRRGPPASHRAAFPRPWASSSWLGRWVSLEGIGSWARLSRRQR